MSRLYMVIFASIISVQGFCSYPTEEEADVLFLSNIVNRANNIDNSQYDVFFARMKQPAPVGSQKIIESKVLNAIMSIDVFVSTNSIDDSRGISIISKEWMRRLADIFQPVDFLTNHVMCLSLARYIGTLKQVEFPDNLLKDTGPRVMMRTLNSYSISDEEIVRIKKEYNEANKIALYEANKEAFDLQGRVMCANSHVRRYRYALFLICGKSVSGCQNVMDSEAFSAFTNQVVRLSNASHDEQKVLFRQINERLLLKDSNETK